MDLNHTCKILSISDFSDDHVTDKIFKKELFGLEL